MEDNCILTSANVFTRMWYIVLADYYQKNLALHRYVVGKGGTILKAFWITVIII